MCSGYSDPRHLCLLLGLAYTVQRVVSVQTEERSAQGRKETGEVKGSSVINKMQRAFSYF